MTKEKDEQILDAHEEKCKMITKLLDEMPGGEHVPQSEKNRLAYVAKLQEASLKTKEGRELVANQILKVIDEVMYYESLAMKALHRVDVDKELKLRDASTQHFAFDENQRIQEVDNKEKLPKFKISTTAKFDSNENHNYDLIARIQDRTKQALLYQIDSAFVKLARFSAKKSDQILELKAPNIEDFKKVRDTIEGHRLICNTFFLNRSNTMDWKSEEEFQIFLNVINQEELLMAGYVGTLLNAQLITTASTNTFELIENNEIIATTSPDWLGVIKIHSKKVEVKEDQFTFIYELSMSIENPYGVAIGIIV
jgi:hypothetical protein